MREPQACASFSSVDDQINRSAERPPSASKGKGGARAYELAMQSRSLLSLDRSPQTVRRREGGRLVAIALIRLYLCRMRPSRGDGVRLRLTRLVGIAPPAVAQRARGARRRLRTGGFGQARCKGEQKGGVASFPVGTMLKCSDKEGGRPSTMVVPRVRAPRPGHNEQPQPTASTLRGKNGSIDRGAPTAGCSSRTSWGLGACEGATRP